MVQDGRLWVAVGWASGQGPRADNQDFAGAWLGSETERARHGMVAALADGVSGGRDGRVAAELAVRTLIEGYYAQPDTIGVAAAVERVMTPYNRWLAAMGRGDTMAHTATTFTGLVMRGRKAHVLHVGDSRAWHLRGDNLRQITSDHTHSHPDRRHILLRALGLEDQLRLDHHELAVAEHDRLLLTSDGVHGLLNPRRLSVLLGVRHSAQADAEAIVEAALAAGGQDNATALVIDVVSLPAVSHDAIAGDLAALPILPPPLEGESVDGFALEKLLSDGRYTRLFRARDTAGGQAVVVKFPKPSLLSESGARAAFAREMLVGSRVASPFVGAAYPVAAERQTRLYGVQPYYEGQTLEQRLAHPVSLREGLRIAIALTRGVAALHRLGIIHRDIKPENVILGEDGSVRLIDLGVARLPRVEDFAHYEIPGTPSFMAPEMFGGNAGDEATDQFALGVCLWRIFAESWPFGEVEAFSRPRFRRPDAPGKTRPDLPAWAEAVLMRCVAIEPGERFGDVVDLLRALEGGAAVERRPMRPLPLIERYPVRFWQAVSLVLLIALVASLVLK
ncbi:bifunctional protein-serine/threonine kinase/phosphatase [Novosphingobium terrae]|uniref:bifunctional protein-serine/threonine kinase/phosphatase n=1 Tax=Novosphingobium terrae TaxID=2726189 RepID=UPI0019800C0F|nr:bifunctional protein-serine/threonine kinase/phosphatase [Novosphingobium terrae]